MARDWPRLPQYNSAEDLLPFLPDGWSAAQISDLYDQLPIGKRFDKKATSDSGLVPVIDQSADGIIGWHNEAPGVEATIDAPVVTFANHTCEMRLMRRPFSVIQNVFPLVGRRGVCETVFLYYLTKGRVWLEEYKGHYPDYRRKWVPLPPSSEQRAIAAVLGSFDNKIELNRKMSETLEAMARALFKSWFVDFNPVRARAEGRDPGLPPEIAALFPDSFQQSEAGEIPKGWHKGSVHEIADVIYGAPFSSKLFNSERIGRPLIRIRDLKAQAPEIYTSEEHPRGYLVQPGDLLVGMDGEFRPYMWTGSPGWMNQRVCCFKPKREVSRAYVHFAIEALLAEVERSEAATTVIHLGKSDIDLFQIIYPSKSLMKCFANVVDALESRILIASQEAATLSALRDALLLKLISGEIRVLDAERLLAKSA